MCSHTHPPLLFPHASLPGLPGQSWHRASHGGGTLSLRDPPTWLHRQQPQMGFPFSLPCVRAGEVNSHGSKKLTACMGPGPDWLLCSQQNVSYCSIKGLDIFKPLLWKENKPWCCFLSQMPAEVSACLANPAVRSSPPQAGHIPRDAQVQAAGIALLFLVARIT